MPWLWATATAPLAKSGTIWASANAAIINAMAAAGIVSLPGMMTGQILAGAPPMQAVAYQIVVMFMIAAAVSFGAMLVVVLAGRHFMGKDAVLRLDRLRNAKL